MQPACYIILITSLPLSLLSPPLLETESLRCSNSLVAYLNTCSQCRPLNQPLLCVCERDFVCVFQSLSGKPDKTLLLAFFDVKLP